VLEELGLTYKSIYLDFNTSEHKKPEFTKFNPNGRVPAIVDHANNDFVLWESNAILTYLTDKYDTKRAISIEASSFETRSLQNQWLFFQASGQV
jgi:glutathione S-transferase